MPSRARPQPALWVRLCDLTRLDPAVASIDRVHAALDQCVGRGTIQRIFEGGLPRLSSLKNIADQLRIPEASLLSDHDPGALPPRPPRDFADRHDVSETDWSLLQAAKVTLTDAERKELLRRYELLMEQAARHMRKAKAT